MKEYHKIQSIYKRDEKTHKFTEEFSLPEFEYLKDNIWVGTEKIDGTNVRVFWDGESLLFGGRTKDAQMPTFLLAKLQEIFTVEKFKALFPETQMTLYGEGFGAKIQKGGGNYISNGVDFILFDVLVGDWWLRREDIEDVAKTLGIKVVPVIFEGTLDKACRYVMNHPHSTFGEFVMEGLVLKPKVELFSRNGSRIITKVKWRDF